MRGETVEPIGTFDVVIVGAGSAGCVLANRLSADPKTRTLLIEAGGRDLNPWIHVPVGYLFTRNRPGTDWCFRTEPEEHFGGRVLPFPLGRVLGGCSSINGMLYVRGQARDYDTWRQLGNGGWGWSDVLPYFKRSENFEGEVGEAHGVGGEWNVQVHAHEWDVLRALIDAGAEVGLPFNADYNAGDNFGISWCQVNQRNGRRSSAATAFLRPARARSNLVVITHAHARRLRVDGREVCGVEFAHDGRVKYAAARETILAAGAIGSPVLMQRSGIGPAALLTEHGIPVVHACEGVGENLHDHTQLRAVYRLSEVTTMNERARSLTQRALIGLEYALFRRGPLTLAPSQLAAYARTDASREDADVQLLFQLGSLDASGRFDTFPAVSIAICNLRPVSRGHVRIRSADPDDAPRIQPNYLSAHEDRAAIAPAVRLMRALLRASPMTRYRPEERSPGDHLRSDADLEAAMRDTGTSLFHPVGSCRMGADATAVVDERLRVKGVGGLRVADASIMPAIVSGNTNAATVMIAEKASDMFREDQRAA